MANKKSDLFGFLKKMNQEDYGYIDRMSDEEARDLAPFVLLMWANGAQGPNAHIHILLTDMYCNPYVFSLGRHPKLLLKLFVAANGGIDNCRYQFVKSGPTKESKDLYAICQFYDCGMTDARQIKRILSDEELKDIVEIYDFKE